MSADGLRLESLDEVAQGLAKNFHGVVDDQPTTLGGTYALRVVAKNDGRTLRPVEGLAAIHDGLLYLVMGGAVAGHSVKDELEAIRASWDWTPIEPPYKHLAFRAKPFSLAAGAATINVPELMYMYKHEHEDQVLDLGLHNVRRNEPDFLAYAQVVTMAEGQFFADYRNRLSEGLCARHDSGTDCLADAAKTTHRGSNLRRSRSRYRTRAASRLAC